MSIQTDTIVQNLQKSVQELNARPQTDLSALEKRISDLEAKYKMLNARVGWNKDKAA